MDGGTEAKGDEKNGEVKWKMEKQRGLKWGGGRNRTRDHRERKEGGGSRKKRKRKRAKKRGNLGFY